MHEALRSLFSPSHKERFVYVYLFTPRCMYNRMQLTHHSYKRSHVGTLLTLDRGEVRLSCTSLQLAHGCHGERAKSFRFCAEGDCADDGSSFTSARERRSGPIFCRVLPVICGSLRRNVPSVPGNPLNR